MSPPEISHMLKEAGIDIAHDFQPTTLKFVYFGIGLFFADYLSHTLFMFTSEVISRVCFYLFLLYFKFVNLRFRLFEKNT